jgi:hypothetical protein
VPNNPLLVILGLVIDSFGIFLVEDYAPMPRFSFLLIDFTAKFDGFLDYVLTCAIDLQFIARSCPQDPTFWASFVYVWLLNEVLVFL